MIQQNIIIAFISANVINATRSYYKTKNSLKVYFQTWYWSNYEQVALELLYYFLRGMPGEFNRNPC